MTKAGIATMIGLLLCKRGSDMAAPKIISSWL